MKIGRFIETQERRQDTLCARETGLLSKLAEKEKKLERTEKTLAKTRKEQILVLQAANHQRMCKGADKKTDDEDRIRHDAVHKYYTMIEQREDLIKSRHKEHRQKSMVAFRTRKEKFDHEAVCGAAADIRDREDHMKAMTKLERYEDKLNRGQARSTAAKSTRSNQMSLFWERHNDRISQYKDFEVATELNR